MLRIGITGGIGSGKTTVCKIFEILNIPIYNSDDRAKTLMREHTELKENIIRHFGEESYIDGDINRNYLANIVFSDKEKLETLNGIVHPAVGKDIQHWFQQHKNELYVLQEAALLFENGSYRSLDLIITVTSPIAIRINRVMNRDKKSEQEIKQRISNQFDDSKRLQLSDFIVNNDGQHSLIQQVWQIHHKIKELSNMPHIV